LAARYSSPRHAPHRKLSAHRRPPIAPTLRPPRRHVARCAGPVRSLQLFSRDPSMRFYCSIGTYPAIRCYHAKPFAISGPFAIRGLPFFPREGSQRGSRHRAGAARPRLRGSLLPRNDQDQRLARLDALRKHTFRHLPPFAICEDTSVRDDWIIEPNNPYCFKISTTGRALGPRREGNPRVERTWH